MSAPVDPTSLSGSVAVVTGAARGMGAAHVRALVVRGAEVLAVDLDGDAAQALVQDVDPTGLSVISVVADVSDPEAWEAVREQAQQRSGQVKILVNNAGIVSNLSISKIEKTGWDRVLDVNLKGTWLGMKTFGPVMREVGGGSIINVSSAAGLTAHGDPAYTASKWGVRGLTKTASQEFGPWNVRVNSIHPGYIDTPMNDFASPELIRAKLSMLPLARAGESWEVAELVAFLASDAAAFITGAEIAIDGGWTSGSQATEARKMA